MDLNFFKQTRVLDGGMGQELLARGMKPNGTLWSANAILDENCINNKEKIIQMFDARFFRMWEFYLAGCEVAFKWGDQVVYQFQLTKNYTSTPVTRDYIYQ